MSDVCTSYQAGRKSFWENVLKYLKSPVIMTQGCLTTHGEFTFLFIYLFLFVVDFVINWNETAMGLHVFPIPIPPPTSLSTGSL